MQFIQNQGELIKLFLVLDVLLEDLFDGLEDFKPLAGEFLEHRECPVDTYEAPEVVVAETNPCRFPAGDFNRTVSEHFLTSFLFNIGLTFEWGYAKITPERG